MNVLLVHSGNSVGKSEDYTFVKQQGDALAKKGVSVFYYAVRQKGWKGYLASLSGLVSSIQENHIDVVHAHFGFCGALSVLQRKVPVVITFHNGETLSWKGKILSSIAAWLCASRIFVAQHVHDKLLPTPRNYHIIPCGIDSEQLEVFEKDVAIKQMRLSCDHPNILFGGSFNNPRKNYPLALEAISHLGYPVNLIEMKGYNRQQVNLLLCACDVFLLPTKSEGSPQVIKEALACNCPIVATAVADIPLLLDGVNNCFATSFDASEIGMRINQIIQSGERSNGRFKIEQLGLDNSIVAGKIVRIYERVLNVK